MKCMKYLGEYEIITPISILGNNEKYFENSQHINHNKNSMK